MRTMVGSIALTAIVAVTGIGIGAPAGAQAEPVATQTYIVRFDDGVDAGGMARRRGDDLSEVTTVLRDVFPGVVTEMTPAEAADLTDDPGVASVEPDGVVRSSAVQNDANWGLDRIDQRSPDLDSTYRYPDAAGAGVDVYVVDSGVRADHQEFAGRMRTGFTTVQDGYGTGDCQGHGTHVAGIAAGTRYGVAKRAAVIPVRVLGCSGTGLTSGVVTALDWVVSHHQRGRRAVANLSFGGGRSDAVDAAVARMTADGIIVAAASGNDGVDACNVSPARVPSVLTVGATSEWDGRKSFSNDGRCLDLFAPGDYIRSASPTAPDAAVQRTGTSMASPFVAGAAAVLWSQNAGWAWNRVASQLVADSTTGIVDYLRPGTPDRLLFSRGPVVVRPPNDAFAAATPIDVTGSGSVQGTTVGATPEPGEPLHSGETLIRSVWWTFTATATGRISLWPTSPTVRPRLYVWQGSALGSLDHMDDADRSTAAVDVDAVGGQTYRVWVLAEGAGEGSVVVHHTGLGRSTAMPWWPFSSAGAMVDRQFRDIVGRGPTAAERTSWTTRLMNGSAVGAHLVTSLRASTDGTTVVDPTVRLYRAVLRRTPDQAGLAFWLDRRRTGGWSLARTAEFFVRSDEFVDRYGALGNRAFVTLIYTDVLGRPGDPDGIAFWTAQLDARRRTRGQVLIGFTESAEHRTALVHEVEAIVAHSALLGRPPTDDEVTTWVTRRRGGTSHAGLVREILVGAAYDARV